MFVAAVGEHINRYPQFRFWLSSEIPTVKEAREKIIVLRDFDTQTTPFRIPYYKLQLAHNHYEPNYVQKRKYNQPSYDAKRKYCQPSYDAKGNGVRENLERVQSEYRSTVYLTYNSDSFIAPRDMLELYIQSYMIM